jgi:hypothetical protein
MKKNKIVLIQLWMGDIPDYFWMHYETTKNINIDFLFITDQLDFKLDAKNYKVIYRKKEDIENLLFLKTNQKIILHNNKKTCDVKISLGDLFEDEIVGYDFFGCYDIDTLFGDTNKYLLDIDNYDIISIADKQFQNRFSGVFLIMRNTEYFRKLYNHQDFYDVFTYEHLAFYEEHYFYLRVKDNHNIKLIYDSTNSQTNNGGKIGYDAYWSNNKVFSENDEIFIHHFYHKNQTIVKKIDNNIYSKYNKKYLNDFYWVFGFTENYSDGVIHLMESIHNYSNRKCIIYGINFDYKVPDKFLISEQFIIKRIDIEEGEKDNRGRFENIINCKPKLMIDVIEQFPDKNLIYIDTDIYLTTSADDLSLYFNNLTTYPLINSHIHDVICCSGIIENEQWTNTVDILAKKIGVNVRVFPRRKTNVMVFDEKSKWFFEEQIDLYEKYKNSEPGIFKFHDEDSANVILSKYGLYDCLHLCDIETSDDLDISTIIDTNHVFHHGDISKNVKLPKNENDVAVFHGMKHNESFQNIQKKYGNKVLDCEEILVYYKNNTIIFEKNSFLTTKIINENVDFIIKDFTGNILLEIKNQEILKNWVYNVDNVYLYEGLYIIEIIKSNSRIKIYNNLIKI